MRSMEIENQIAFDNNNLASFRKKWATFKHSLGRIGLPLNNARQKNDLIYTIS